jgi:hypothetical protein
LALRARGPDFRFAPCSRGRPRPFYRILATRRPEWKKPGTSRCSASGPPGSTSASSWSWPRSGCQRHPPGWPAAGDEGVRHHRRQLLDMADWLRCWQVERAGMEATSDYWKPVYFLPEPEGFDCLLYQASQVKALPGRPKTDQLTELPDVSAAQARYTSMPQHPGPRRPTLPPTCRCAPTTRDDSTFKPPRAVTAKPPTGLKKRFGHNQLSCTDNQSGHLLVRSTGRQVLTLEAGPRPAGPPRGDPGQPARPHRRGRTRRLARRDRGP